MAAARYPPGTDSEKFRAKARAFLRAHMDHVAIEKLRTNKPLTTADLAELERMLVEGGLGGSDEVRRAAEESNGLGLFVRSLVGMDRSAAKDAMAAFLSGTSHSANQIEFVNLVVDHLTEHGVVTAERLSGPEALYTAHMRSVADALRLETSARVLALPLEARIALALSLGDEDLARYVAHTGLDADEARQHLHAQHAHGRTPSRAAGDFRS